MDGQAFNIQNLKFKIKNQSSHPFRYSLTRYLFASGTFVIFIPTVSYSTFLPALNATAPSRIVSVIGPAFKKLPGDCVLFLNASIQTLSFRSTASGVGCCPL